MSQETLPPVADCASHREAMERLVGDCGWTKGAEIGVGSAKLSRRLMERWPALSLIALDGACREDRIEEARELAALHGDRYRLLEMESLQAAPLVGQRSLDFVFIDAGHSYRAVHDDIRAWREKVRPDGWLLGRDYGHPKYRGVAEAVDEWFGSRVQLIGHTIWAVPGSKIHAPMEPVR